MSNLNQMELSSIRETVGAHKMMHAKLTEYAEKCTDPTIRQMFQQSATEAQKSAQNLLQML